MLHFLFLKYNINSKIVIVIIEKQWLYTVMMKILDKIYHIQVWIHIKFLPEMTLQSSAEININLT